MGKTLNASDGGYPLLHTLPLFKKGFDIFTRHRGPLCTPEMGGDYKGYKAGDFPVTEDMRARLVCLPVMSNPVPEAAVQVTSAIRRVAEHAERIKVRGQEG